jgi:hypothetical protein
LARTGVASPSWSNSRADRTRLRTTLLLRR